MIEIVKKNENKSVIYSEYSVLHLIFSSNDNIDVKKWFTEIGKHLIERKYPKNHKIVITTTTIRVVKNDNKEDKNVYVFL
jgi:hypothetical protein